MAKSVVVSEDDPDIVALITDVLELEGYEVLGTMGAETPDVVRRSHPDVLVLDYQMPGMDGLQIARRIRSDPSTRDVPIILMTAAGRVEKLCGQMEANGCLGKPFDIAQLIDAVENLTHSSH